MTIRKSLTPKPPIQQAAAPAPEREATKNAWGVCTEHKRVIDGWEYTVSLYGSEQGFGYLPLFVSLASGPVGVALETVGNVLDAKGDLTRAKINGAGVADALHNAAAVIIEVGGASKVREMLSHTIAKAPNGKMGKCDDEFDTMFQGRYWHLVKVLAFVCEVNYGPFGDDVLSGILSRWTEISAKYADASSAPPPV